MVLTQRTSPAVAAREIRHALGPQSGLSVETAQTHTARQIALSRQAPASLSQIATLIPSVAVLAMAAAMGALIRQRRPRLAKLKLEGIFRIQLWATILLEGLALVAATALAIPGYLAASVPAALALQD